MHVQVQKGRGAEGRHHFQGRNTPPWGHQPSGGRGGRGGLKRNCVPFLKYG